MVVDHTQRGNGWRRHRRRPGRRGCRRPPPVTTPRPGSTAPPGHQLSFWLFIATRVGWATTMLVFPDRVFHLLSGGPRGPALADRGAHARNPGAHPGPRRMAAEVGPPGVGPDGRPGPRCQRVGARCLRPSPAAPCFDRSGDRRGLRQLGKTDRYDAAMSRTSRALDPPRPCALRDYAFVADGERGAVIGPEGDISWLCFPHWDSPAVFSNLIGGQGHYTITPVGRFVWGGYYEEGTLIWHSRWVTTSGIVECHEALAFPGDPGTVVVLRRVLAVERRRARYRWSCTPGWPMAPSRSVDSTRTTKALGAPPSDALRWRWTGLADARPEPDGHRGHGLVGEITLAEGEHRDLVLELSEGPLGTPIDPQRSWDATRARWHDTVPRLEHTAARRDARHAYAVIRGPHRHQRRHGGRRHHLAAGTSRTGTELRLPLRLDPRSVAWPARPSPRPPARTRCCATPWASWWPASSRTGPT